MMIKTVKTAKRARAGRFYCPLGGIKGGRHWLRSQGYTLVVLAMAVTVLNIMLAMALPGWSNWIQRQKEQELIFRGLQYAEAIRVFQLRHNRLPNRLQELIEVEPRAIRQLWLNPMAEDGAWLLLPAMQNQQQNQRNRNQRNQPNRPSQPNQPGNRAQPGRQPQLTAVRVVPPRRGEPSLTPAPTQPFIGVASPEGESAVITFMNSREVVDWRFTVELVQATQQATREGALIAQPVNSGIFWKPFPEGINPPNMQQPNNPGMRPNNQAGGNRAGGNSGRVN